MNDTNAIHVASKPITMSGLGRMVQKSVKTIFKSITIFGEEIIGRSVVSSRKIMREGRKKESYVSNSVELC